MNKIFKALTVMQNKEKKEYRPRIKKSGEALEKMKKLADAKGLELYPCTLTKTYYLWKDGSSFEGTYDGFNTLKQVKTFLETYNSNQ